MTRSSLPPTKPQDVLRESRALMVLGLPLVGSAIAGFLINMTDTLFLGWYNVESLAAATIATSFFFNVFVLGAGFGNAVLPMIAEAVAAGDTTRTRRATRMAMWLSMAYGAVAMPLFWYSGAILTAIGQAPEVAQLGQDYLRIAMWGMIPALLVNVLRCYLSAQYLTQVQLWVTMGAVVVNAVFNYALIFGNFGMPEWGIKGAAFGGVLVQFGTLAVLLTYALRKLPEVRLLQRIWRVDTGAIRDVFKLGLPIGVTAISESGMFYFSAVMMGWLGTIELASHGVALQLASLAFMFHVGMTQAATVRAGGAFGRGDRADLVCVGKAAIFVSAMFAVIAIVAFLLLRYQLVGLFISPVDPQRDAVVALGALLVIFAALFQAGDAMQIVALSLLRGVQDTRVPMWLAAFSYWGVGLPSGYILSHHFGLDGAGVWMGLTIGLACSATLLMLRFWLKAVRI